MAPIGKLYGAAVNPRFRRALAVATLAGLEVETDASFSMASNWKTPEFLAKFPLGYLPAFEGADGVNLQESGAIADYFASLAPNSNLIPADVNEAAEVRQWQYFADQEVFIRLALANRILTGRLPYNKGVFEGVVNEVVARLEALDKVLLKKTYIVGERITIADVFLASALASAFTSVIDASIRAKIPNVVRYTNTIIQSPKLAAIYDNGNTEFIEKQPQFVAPTKEKKEKAPKAEQPKAEKKEKAPKKKEDDEEAEEPLVPEEPKAKNPLDLLPKSTFNLEDFKRAYSNLDTRGAGGSLEYFYDKMDWEGFSVWRCQYKYNDELTLTFMSANLIGGLFARFEASRKYLFGSMLVLGTANDSLIDGVLILRGQDAAPVVQVAPDWESYNFTKLDVQNNADDKKFFEDSMAWELTIDGHETADGKNFK